MDSTIDSAKGMGTGGRIPIYDLYEAEPPRVHPTHAYVDVDGDRAGRWDNLEGATVERLRDDFGHVLTRHQTHQVLLDFRGPARGTIRQVKFVLAPTQLAPVEQDEDHARLAVDRLARLNEQLIAANQSLVEQLLLSQERSAHVQVDSSTKLYQHLATLEERDRARREAQRDREDGRYLSMMQLTMGRLETEAQQARAALDQAQSRAGQTPPFQARMAEMVEAMMMRQLEGFVTSLESGGQPGDDHPVWGLLSRLRPVLDRFIDGVEDAQGNVTPNPNP